MSARLPTGLVERIIRGADREHPADAVLRQTLKGERHLSPDQTAAVSRAVFAYYRWKGWLPESEPLGLQVEEAIRLAERFKQNGASFSDQELVARTVPEWVTGQMPVTPEWARAIQAEPVIWLRAKRSKVAEVEARLGHCRPFGEAAPGCLEYSGKADLFQTPEFQAGDFELQDLTSQAVGWVCAPKPGQTWWDACAGEGGKLIHLSELMENKGLLWASDRAEWRLDRLKRRAARAGVFNYRRAAWSGGAKLPTRTRFDGVLVDAPCSGTGTWQRNPHARWTATPRDVAELSQLQGNLLKNAAEALKPGGRLIYAVCTLTRTETIGVADAFEIERPDYARLDFPHPLRPGAASQSRLAMLPQDFRGNGMFIAAWTRK